MKSRTILGLGLVLVTALYATYDSPQAQSAAAGISVGPQAAIGAARAWTIDELRSAVEYPLPTLQGRPREGIGGAAPAGTPTFIPGGEPGDVASAALAVTGSPEILGRFNNAAYAYPPPFTNYDDSYRSKLFPEKTTGVLFFTQYGTRYRCSAESTGANYSVMTAGHCVHAGDNSGAGWSYDIVFIPGYDATKVNFAPYGQWTGAYPFVLSDWLANGNPNGFDSDIGGVVLNTLDGRKISRRVGYLGFAYNVGYIQHWNGLGYPAGAPFDGRTLQNCQSSYAFQDDLADAGGSAVPPTIGRGCNHTGGTSGGPWVLAYQVNRAGANNYLNGVMSYKWSDLPLAIYGPYFSDQAKAVWDCARNSSPTTFDCVAPPQP